MQFDIFFHYFFNPYGNLILVCYEQHRTILPSWRQTWYEAWMWRDHFVPLALLLPTTWGQNSLYETDFRSYYWCTELFFFELRSFRKGTMGVALKRKSKISSTHFHTKNDYKAINLANIYHEGCNFWGWKVMRGIFQNAMYVQDKTSKYQLVYICQGYLQDFRFAKNH